VQSFVRAFFEYLYEHPELRGLMVRELSTEEPIPEAVLGTFQANFGVLSRLIQEGQAAGEIREGDPMMLALATATQPVALNLVRPVLEQAGPGGPRSTRRQRDSLRGRGARGPRGQ
jgi:hypothetical protein